MTSEADRSSGPEAWPDAFPSAYAESGRLSFGNPDKFAIDRAETQVFFLRSGGAREAKRSLWRMDIATGAESCVVDAGEPQAGQRIPEAERLRRERSRDIGTGIDSFSIDAHGRRVAISMSGRLLVMELAREGCQCIEETGGTHPLMSPDGTHVAYAKDGAVFCQRVGLGQPERVTREEPTDSVYWGVPEFTAAEEMFRMEGMWWTHDSRYLLMTRVDDSALENFWVSDLSDQSSSPRRIRFPLSGGQQSLVSLYVYDSISCDLRELSGWDKTRFPYLVRVICRQAAVVLVQSRDQTAIELLVLNTANAKLEPLLRRRAEPWFHIHAGLPTLEDDGTITSLEIRNDKRILCTKEGLSICSEYNVEQYMSSGNSRIITTFGADSLRRTAFAVTSSGGVVRLSRGHTTAVYIHGKTLVIQEEGLESTRATTRIIRQTTDDVWVEAATVQSHAAEIDAVVNWRRLEGNERWSGILVLPVGHDESRPLPVICDAYGGPLVRKAIESKRQLVVAQWFADNGFAVLIADGRGTPSASVRQEQSVAGNLMEYAVQDQLSALEHACGKFPFLDRERVVIRGWSFGGYLAAAALMTAPDRFQGAICGAPVVDWRLYDAYYSERYLGSPRSAPASYERSSLLTGKQPARGRLLLIHGLADDNVLVQHSVAFAGRLFYEDCEYRFLPLPSGTHLAPIASRAARLLVRELSFVRECTALGKKL